jgi:cytochrome P450
MILSILFYLGLAYAAYYLFLRPKTLISKNGVALPIIGGSIPWLGCGISFVLGPPRAYLCLQRSLHGDNFLLFMFGRYFLYVFSTSGLTSLYNIRENEASFVEATKGLLGLKLPAEVLDGSMKKFHSGLRHSLLFTYLTNIAESVETVIGSGGILGPEPEGELEIFSFCKQIVHRIGFSCWIGAECCSPQYLPELINCYEACDPEQGFQSLPTLATTILTNKAKEKHAIQRMANLLREIWQNRAERRREQQNSQLDVDNLDEIVGEATEEKTGTVNWRKVACSVLQFHVASQANLYAAISWTLVNLLTQPKAKLAELQQELRDNLPAESQLVDESYLIQLEHLHHVILESLRLAQQSITLRKTMKECNFSVENEIYSLPKGLYIATLLSITNFEEKSVKSDKPLAEFWPSRYNSPEFAQNYHISTFGHSFHRCPGYDFSILAIKLIVCKLLLNLEMTAQFEEAEIPAGSIGAIARATKPCIVKYKKLKPSK